MFIGCDYIFGYALVHITISPFLKSLYYNENKVNIMEKRCQEVILEQQRRQQRAPGRPGLRLSG